MIRSLPLDFRILKDCWTMTTWFLFVLLLRLARGGPWPPLLLASITVRASTFHLSFITIASDLRITLTMWRYQIKAKASIWSFLIATGAITRSNNGIIRVSNNYNGQHVSCLYFHFRFTQKELLLCSVLIVQASSFVICLFLHVSYSYFVSNPVMPAIR